jgi:hypothetical protein
MILDYFGLTLKNYTFAIFGKGGEQTSRLSEEKEEKG